MTDKQEMIIDSVDVSGCEKYPLSNKWHGSIIFCKGGCNVYPNCEYKQLRRKTAECEELKKQLETSEEWQIKAESLNEKLELRNTRYRKALEEIEGMLQVIVESNKVYPLRSNLYKILDIIRKAKGEEE